MAVEIEIYFDDLKPMIQKEFLDKLGTSMEDENWNIVPIAIYVIEDEDNN